MLKRQQHDAISASIFEAIFEPLVETEPATKLINAECSIRRTRGLARHQAKTHLRSHLSSHRRGRAGTQATSPMLSLQPLSKPSTVPSSRPSLTPSDEPSLMPSSNPSSRPSSTPREDPSSKPSQQPSSRPRWNPSDAPSSIVETELNTKRRAIFDAVF
jgi:hypothetical protein